MIRHTPWGWAVTGAGRRLAWCAIAVAVCLCGWGAAGVRAAELLDRVIAVVSGTVITLSDARTAIAFGLVDTSGAPDQVAVAMQWLVDRQLVLDEVNRYETPDPDPTVIDPVFEEIRRKLSAGKGFGAALATLGHDEEGARTFVRDTVRMQLYLKRRFESVLPGTEEELRQFYEAHKRAFVRAGRALTFEDARDAVQEGLQEQRRVQALENWLGRLRRRADVNELYMPIR
jgi:hypothetical protein